MQLIQIFLPRYDNDRHPLPSRLFQQVREELLDEFAGLTCHTRAPAEGYWGNDASHTQRDEIFIFEIITETVDKSWWKNYRHELERRFRQEEILIRSHNVELL